MSSYLEYLLLFTDALHKSYDYGGELSIKINPQLVNYKTPKEYLMDLRFSSEMPSLDDLNKVEKCNEENKLIEVRLSPFEPGSCFYKFGTNLEDVSKEIVESLISNHMALEDLVRNNIIKEVYIENDTPITPEPGVFIPITDTLKGPYYKLVGEV